MKGVVAGAGVDGNPLLPPLDIPSSTFSRWIPAASCSGRTCCCCLSAQWTEAEDGVGEMGVGIGVAGFEPLSSCLGDLSLYHFLIL